MSSITRLRLTLESDIIFSDRPKTAGGHETRPYIPGSALLGACAAQLYASFDQEGISFSVFHSGSVRFMNAYPEDAPHPMPLCLFREKGIEEGPALNFLHIGEEERAARMTRNIQDRQLRTGFISEDGRETTIKSLYRMKTAVDRNKRNRAAESQLFGYEALPRHTRWIGAIKFDDGIANDVRERIVRSLTGKTLRVGKSRTAEYGGDVVITEAPAPAEPVKSFSDSGRVVFYCRSDVALTDPGTGMPTATPVDSCFHLDGAEFYPEQSFIRTRTYATYNRTRCSFDCERIVIAAGSVIVFNFSGSLPENYAGLCAEGIGDHLTEGLGEVLVNPAFLGQREVNLRKMEKKAAGIAIGSGKEAAINETLKRCPDPALGLLLADRFKRISRSDAAADARSHTDRFEQLYKRPSGLPGKSQWSNVRQAAVIARDGKQLSDALFGEKGICTHGVRKSQWNAEVRMEGIDFSLSDYLGVLVQEPGELAKRLDKQKADELQKKLKKFVEYEADFVRVRDMLMMIGRSMAERLKEAR